MTLNSTLALTTDPNPNPNPYQAYLQGLARLAAPELTPPPAELLWVEALRRELLDFLHPSSDAGADSDEEEGASSLSRLYGTPVAAAAAVTAGAVSAGAAVVVAAAAAVHRADSHDLV